MAKDGLRFQHLRFPSAGGAITFAIKVVDNATWVQFSYALCSPQDQFCREKGRLIAEGRLNCNRHSRVSGFKISSGVTWKQINAAAIQLFFADAFRREQWIIRCSWLEKYIKQLKVIADDRPVLERAERRSIDSAGVDQQEHMS